MRKFTKNIFTDKKLSSARKAEYLLVISKLLKNGFSLSQSINCLRLLNDNDEMFKLIYQDLCSGKMISQSLKHLKLPTVVFNQLVISQQHGHLELALEQTGILLQNQAKQKNKLKELLAYPSFILMFLITMLLGMKIYIVPQLEISGGNKMIDLFLQFLLLMIFLSIVSIILLTFSIKRKKEYQRALLLVKLPVFGKIYLNFYQFLILQGLGMQMSSGMNLFDICESNKRFQKDSVQAYIADKFIKGLTKGDNLFSLIKKEPLLPRQLEVILRAGESGPRLAQDLLLMSELKFEEIQRDLKRILGFVQPLLFGIIAIVIVVTYLIVLMPIYGMMKGMS